MNVDLKIDYADVENDEGYTVGGLCIVCKRCGHSVEVLGEFQASARRGAKMLREECPRGESNFYDADWWS